VLFPNMSLEILCQFLFESSEIIFERPKKLVWTEIFSVHFCIFTIAIRNSRLEPLFIYQLVEQNLPYKMYYLSFFLSFDKTSQYLSSLHPRF